jgi:predicted nucleic acid-binding protein
LNACIVDASVAIKWVVPETGTAEALALFGNRLLAPALLQAEAANILWKKVKRGELSASEARIAARLLASFRIEFCSPGRELTRVLELAMALDHAAYDCVYLALAEERGVPMVTADAKLIRLTQAARQSSRVLDRILVVPLISQPAVN